MKVKHNYQNKHLYYNDIYQTLHPNYDQDKRLYTKHCENFDFIYKKEKLKYLKDNDLDVKAAQKVFPGLKEKDINPNLRSIQNRISYYLCNRMVPGFNPLSLSEYKKEKVIFEPATTRLSNYNVDKWYFQKGDDRKKFYEKMFLEKEIDKQRKKNEAEKYGKKQ